MKKEQVTKDKFRGKKILEIKTMTEEIKLKKSEKVYKKGKRYRTEK